MTGKFIICAAKIKAAMMPIKGICRSLKFERALRTAITINKMLTVQKISAIGADKNPSGICMATGFKNGAGSIGYLRYSVIR
ncbi:MAG: hypothetical protein ACK2UW_24615 [Anaerolineales bacterium]